MSEAYIPLVSAFVALCAAIASSYFAARGQRRQYFAELRKWADEACDTLSEAVHACDLNPGAMGKNEFFMIRHGLRHTLSSLIDRGRWFFPNLLRRNGAFDGIRQPALSYLVRAYELVDELDYFVQEPNLVLRDQFVEQKRKFTTEVQSYLDPRKRLLIFMRLTRFTGSESIYKD